MVTAGAAPEVWTRAEAIARLRDGLLQLSDGEHSMCQVAAELGVFCRGFRRWSDGEFLRRWTKVIGGSTLLTRPQLEQVADLWQLTEQLRLRVPLACDAQTIARGACRGWNEFSNEGLASFCDEILGRNVVVTTERRKSLKSKTTVPESEFAGLDLGIGPGSILTIALGGKEERGTRRGAS